jgi:hypothetical protein
MLAHFAQFPKEQASSEFDRHVIRVISPLVRDAYTTSDCAPYQPAGTPTPRCYICWCVPFVEKNVRLPENYKEQTTR